MANLQQDIDDLDRMVDTGAAKENIRTQIRFIFNQVAVLESNFAQLAENFEKLRAAQPPATPSFENRRGIYYAIGDSIPFCPHCWEVNAKKVHLSGPVKMMNAETEYWECHACNKDYYSAKPGENFLAKPARPGRRR